MKHHSALILAAITSLTALSASALAASTNYKAAHRNDDGRVTIERPAFRAGGGDLPLARTSDLSGVCKLYGFGAFVANSLVKDKSGTPRSVVIGSDSRMKAFAEQYYTIRSLDCEDRPHPGTSRRAARIVRNDDDTYYVLNPRFSYAGAEKPFTRVSSPGGICQLMGFDSFASESQINSTQVHDAVSVDANGFVTSRTSQYFIVESLICASTASTPAPSSRHEGVFVNDDGSITLKDPAYGNDHVQFRISRLSSPDGVCRLFGHGSALPGSMLVSKSTPDTVTISADGKFARYTSGYLFVTSVTCQPSGLFPAMPGPEEETREQPATDPRDPETPATPVTPSPQPAPGTGEGPKEPEYDDEF